MLLWRLILPPRWLLCPALAAMHCACDGSALRWLPCPVLCDGRSALCSVPCDGRALESEDHGEMHVHAKTLPALCPAHG